MQTPETRRNIFTAEIVTHQPMRAPEPIRCATVRLGQMAGWDAAIVIPARDEEKRVRACLDAAGHAIRRAAGIRVGIVLVVNNTSDATALRAFDWAAGQGIVPFVLIHCEFSAAEAGVGAARRLGLDTACGHVAPHGALLTTDADTVVRDDWVIRNLAELHEADLICGTLIGLPDEARALPASVAAHGSVELDYLEASLRLVARLDPRLHDPAPAHRSSGGASMAVSRKVYEAVGGLPALPIDEDRSFAELVDAHDFRIRFSAAAVVETSCRMTGRTWGGMAGTLRARAAERDPWADEWMEAADMFALRHGLCGRLRALWPDARALHGALSDVLGQPHADRIMTGPPGPHFGAFFAAVEQRTPRLARCRLRLSDCRRELPRLRSILETQPATCNVPARFDVGLTNRAAV